MAGAGAGPVREVPGQRATKEGARQSAADRPATGEQGMHAKHNGEDGHGARRALDLFQKPHCTCPTWWASSSFAQGRPLTGSETGRLLDGQRTTLQKKKKKKKKKEEGCQQPGRERKC